MTGRCIWQERNRRNTSINMRHSEHQKTRESSWYLTVNESCCRVKIPHLILSKVIAANYYLIRASIMSFQFLYHIPFSV